MTNEQEYLHLKDKIKKWIENNYEPAKSVTHKVYSLLYELDNSVGYISIIVLKKWLIDWGYIVKTVNVSYTHDVVLLKKRRKPKSKVNED